MDCLSTLQPWHQPVSVYPHALNETPSSMNIKIEPGMDLSSDLDPRLPSLPPFQQIFSLNRIALDALDGDDMLQSWSAKHPHHWSYKEVLDWVFCVVRRDNRDEPSLRGENFATISGVEFCQMTRDEFLMLDPNHGAHIFDCLQDLLIRESATFPGLEIGRRLTDDIFPEHTPPGEKFIDATNLADDEIKVQIGEDIYDIDFKPFDIPGITGDVYDPGYHSEACSDRDSDCQSVFTDTTEPEISPNDAQYMMPPNDCYHTDQSSVHIGEGGRTDFEGQGRQRTEKRRKTRKNKLSNGSHLWEFCRDALNDPKFNPDMLMWENKEEGVFRFVRSGAVARLWGRKKNNPNMTYEKLSRAMRFCRTEGFFSAIPKIGKYPKKLCFKFGEKAIGWKN